MIERFLFQTGKAVIRIQRCVGRSELSKTSGADLSVERPIMCKARFMCRTDLLKKKKRKWRKCINYIPVVVEEQTRKFCVHFYYIHVPVVKI